MGQLKRNCLHSSSANGPGILVTRVSLGSCKGRGRALSPEPVRTFGAGKRLCSCPMADSSSYCSKRPQKEFVSPQADVSHRDPNPAPPDSCPHGEPDRAAEHGQIPASFRVLPHKHSHLRTQVLTADQLRWWTVTKKTAKQKTANGVGLQEL